MRSRGSASWASAAEGMLSETGYAKVNLALHVRARRPDGYHELESLFVFCADGDGLTAEALDSGLTLEIDGPFAAELAADDDNLVLRAARALQETAGVETGAALRLTKRLPIASGIGGGSADAAAALRLLAKLWGVEADLYGIAEGLGADVPACVASRTLFGSGTGTELRPLDLGIGGTPILLVNPLVVCPTGPVFRAWDQLDRGALSPDGWREGRNDLQPPAVALVPEIAQVLDTLAALLGATLSRMSGSGATCFALFGDAATRDAAEAAIHAAHPGWWTLASTIR